MLTATLTSLLGQPDVSAFLRGVVARGRYANAYLFHGPAGVGKCTAALSFARALLCERIAGAAPAGAGGAPRAGAPPAAAPGARAPPPQSAAPPPPPPPLPLPLSGAGEEPAP